MKCESQRQYDVIAQYSIIQSTNNKESIQKHKNKNKKICVKDGPKHPNLQTPKAADI